MRKLSLAGSHPPHRQIQPHSSESMYDRIGAGVEGVIIKHH